MGDLCIRHVGERSTSALRNGARMRRKMRGIEPRLRAAIEPLELRRLLSVSIINGAGAGYRGNGSGGPPDVTGAAGPSSYLEVTNDTVTLFSPKGPNRTILTQRGISDFFYNSTAGNQTLIDAPGNIVSNIAASPTGATEAGNTVTITTAV